jgi:very-short-patch-repair endonuclease
LAGLKHPRVERAVDHALFSQATSIGQLWLLYDDEWTRGRRGVAILRDLLIQRTPEKVPTQSELERMFYRLVKDRRLPTPVRQFPIDVGISTVHPDFAYPDVFLAIEVDSYAWHMDRAAFERDRERDNALQSRGWMVLRFTWAKIRWEPDAVADIVLRNLEARRGSRMQSAELA